jgi:hypothetical protein
MNQQAADENIGSIASESIGRDKVFSSHISLLSGPPPLTSIRHHRRDSSLL